MIAERDYVDIVKRTGFNDESAKIYFIDGSFLEVRLYRHDDLMKRYAFHWKLQNLKLQRNYRR